MFSGGRDRVDVRRLDLDHAVVADHVRPLGDVLLADHRRPVAGLAQRMDDVLAVVVEHPAAMREAEHAVRVPVLAGQQRGAAAGARRDGAERLAEHDPLVGELRDVGRGHRIPVGLQIAPGVVRVQVQDVGRTAGHRRDAR
jgi:hypothetical protein